MTDTMLKKILVSGLIFLLIVSPAPAFTKDNSTHLESSKVDPRLRYLINKNDCTDNTHSKILKKMNKEFWADVFIHCSNPSDLVGHEAVQIRLKTESMVVAWINLSQIQSIIQISTVSFIEAASLCHPLLDQSVPAIQVDRVHNGELGVVYTGKNVLIGIIDYGIDWAHPDFQDGSGNSRILYLWDQTAVSIQSPNGVVYTQVELTSEINGLTSGHILATDLTGHGTHITGIAAGNGQGTGNGQPGGRYKGIAHEADLIVVKVEHSGFVHDTNITEAIAFILEKANDLNRPVAINLSIGQQQGSHDGTSSYEKTVDQLMGEKGQVLIVAAGNERNAPIHFKHDFQNENEIFEVTFEVDCIQEGQFDYAGFDIWYASGAGLNISIKTPLGTTYGPVQSLSDSNWETSEGEINIDNASGGAYTGNNDMNCYLRISDTQSSTGFTDNLYPGTWTLIFQGQPNCRVDGWLFESSSSAWLSSQIDTTTLIAEPGNARRCLTVGSYISRKAWPSLAADPGQMDFLTVGALSDFSSAGPTRPNSNDPLPRQKPEVTAPGEYILSSMSREVSISMSNNHWVATDSVHWAQKGTSMAAPHVTGVVALLLEAQPDLTVSEMKNLILLHSQREFFPENKTWDSSWGFGKLDGYKMLDVLTTVSQKRSTLPQQVKLFPNFPNPFNSQTTISYQISGDDYISVPVFLAVYNIRGERVKQLVETNQTPGHYTIWWDGLDQSGAAAASGVYVLLLKANKSHQNRKLILLQ